MNQIDDMIEGYLDPDEKFYDYRTGEVSGSDIFDKTTTGVSFYNQFLGTSELEYLKNKKNLVGSVVYMSPEEYYSECAKHAFGRVVSVQQLKSQRAADKQTLEHLKDVLTVYKRKFPMPFINYAEKGQEGLHRMYVAGELFGWTDSKHPVLVINWADEARHEREEKAKSESEIRYAIEQAVKDSLQYKFTDIEDFSTQLEFELDRKFEFIDEVSKPVQFDLSVKNENCIIVVHSVSYSFPIEDIQITNDDVPEDTELDDIELDDLDEFLAKYIS